MRIFEHPIGNLQEQVAALKIHISLRDSQIWDVLVELVIFRFVKTIFDALVNLFHIETDNLGFFSFFFCLVLRSPLSKVDLGSGGSVGSKARSGAAEAKG